MTTTQYTFTGIVHNIPSNNTNEYIIEETDEESRYINLWEEFVKIIYKGFLWIIKDAPLHKIIQLLIGMIWFNILILISIFVMLFSILKSLTLRGFKKIIDIGILFTEEVILAEYNNGGRRQLYLLIMLDTIKICKIAMVAMDTYFR